LKKTLPHNSGITDAYVAETNITEGLEATGNQPSITLPRDVTFVSGVNVTLLQPGSVEDKTTTVSLKIFNL